MSWIARSSGNKFGAPAGHRSADRHGQRRLRAIARPQAGRRHPGELNQYDGRENYLLPATTNGNPLEAMAAAATCAGLAQAARASSLRIERD
jgi:hypothetical protein